jgi:hypothetical protein
MLPSGIVAVVRDAVGLPRMLQALFPTVEDVASGMIVDYDRHFRPGITAGTGMCFGKL